jgi:hypothetical protein
MGAFLFYRRPGSQMGWWGVLDLNQRLLPCEDSTLPLS